MNPELRRNLWLELSVHRLLATPALIALVSMLILVNSNGRGHTALATVAGFACLVLLTAWGSNDGRRRHRRRGAQPHLGCAAP